MFGKTTKSSYRPDTRDLRPVEEPAEHPSHAPVAAPAPTPPRNLSTLASDLRIDGSLSGQCDLQIEGTIKGNVHVGRLIVGESGVIDGNVSADYLEIRGRVVGTVTGKQVKLIATAYVEGDITAEQLSIDIGAYFQGRVLQSRRETVVASQGATDQGSGSVVHSDSLPAPTTANALPVQPQE